MKKYWCNPTGVSLLIFLLFGFVCQVSIKSTFADEVEKGTVTTIKKLDEAFVHANRALSGHP
jgi:hypothetical protein